MKADDVIKALRHALDGDVDAAETVIASIASEEEGRGHRSVARKLRSLLCDVTIKPISHPEAPTSTPSPRHDPEQLSTIRVHIRWMIRRDMPEVLSIESRSFDNPWSEEDFIRALRQRNCIGMVCEYEDRVIGYMIYELHKKRIHLLNLAVDYDYRRKSVGRQMVDKLLGKLYHKRRTRVLMEIREHNLEAQLWAKACGCKYHSTLREWCDDTSEDAYLFELRRDEPAATS